MTDIHEFADLVLRRAALEPEGEVEAARCVDELAVGLGVEGETERTEVTTLNLEIEATNQVIRFWGVPQSALRNAVEQSPSRAQIARYFLTPGPAQ